MNENENPFYVIHQELLIQKALIIEQTTLIERLIYNQQPLGMDILGKYEVGVEVAMDELGAKNQTIYQNINKIPHKKMFNKLYFNRIELRNYIKNGSKN